MKEKMYLSTRGDQKPLNFYEAILQGIGSDGGLLVPEFDVDQKDLKALLHMNYVDMATEIISTFTPDDVKEDIRKLCQKAYGDGLFPKDVVPVEKQAMFMLLNYSKAQQRHLKIWHCHYCHIL